MHALHFQEKRSGERRVLFIVLIFLDDPYLRLRELLRPVALLTGLSGGSQIVDRRRDGLGIGIKGNAKNLTNP